MIFEVLGQLRFKVWEDLFEKGILLLSYILGLDAQSDKKKFLFFYQQLALLGHETWLIRQVYADFGKYFSIFDAAGP